MIVRLTPYVLYIEGSKYRLKYLQRKVTTMSADIELYHDLQYSENRSDLTIRSFFNYSEKNGKVDCESQIESHCLTLLVFPRVLERERALRDSRKIQYLPRKVFKRSFDVWNDRSLDGFRGIWRR